MDKKSLDRSRKLLGIVIACFWASEYAHVPYFTPYLKSLGFGASIIGIMTGTYGFTQMCVRIPLGIATDLTSGYRNVVIMGTVFTTVSSLGLIFAEVPWFIIFCRFLAGVASSTWLAFSVLYSAYYDAGEGVKAMTNINIFNNIGKLVAYILGIITATLFGYKYPLVISFLAGLAAIAFALQLKSIPIKKEPISVANLLSTFGNPGVLIPAAFAIVMQMILQGTVFSFNSGVAELLGGSRLQIGFGTTLHTMVIVFGSNALRKHFMQKFPEKYVISAGFLCLALACLFVGLGTNIWFVFLGQAVSGIGIAILMSLLMALSIRTVPMERKSTAMGLYQALYGIGMTIGPVCMGRLTDLNNYTFAYIIYAAVAFLAMLAALVLIPWMEKHAPAL